jgi:hypothetical protein
MKQKHMEGIMSAASILTTHMCKSRTRSKTNKERKRRIGRRQGIIMWNGGPERLVDHNQNAGHKCGKVHTFRTTVTNYMEQCPSLRS